MFSWWYIRGFKESRVPDTQPLNHKQLRFNWSAWESRARSRTAGDLLTDRHAPPAQHTRPGRVAAAAGALGKLARRKGPPRRRAAVAPVSLLPRQQKGQRCAPDYSENRSTRQSNSDAEAHLESEPSKYPRGGFQLGRVFPALRPSTPERPSLALNLCHGGRSPFRGGNTAVRAAGRVRDSVG